MRIAGCFLEYNGKFVILYRHAHKPDGATWGLPGGKVEAGESSQEAVIRELFEETGYQASPDELEHLGDYDYVSSSNKPYTYCTYRVKLAEPHDVQLETQAHGAYEWVSAEECDAKPDLILGFDTLLRLTKYIQD